MESKMKVDVERLSPDQLLTTFTKTPLLLCILLAFLLHVVVIGGTGYSTILDTIDPGRVEAREKAEQDRLQQEAKDRAAQREAEQQARQKAKADRDGKKEGDAGTDARDGDATTGGDAGTAPPIDDPFKGMGGI